MPSHGWFIYAPPHFCSFPRMMRIATRRKYSPENGWNWTIYVPKGRVHDSKWMVSWKILIITMFICTATLKWRFPWLAASCEFLLEGIHFGDMDGFPIEDGQTSYFDSDRSVGFRSCHEIWSLVNHQAHVSKGFHPAVRTSASHVALRLRQRLVALAASKSQAFRGLWQYHRQWGYEAEINGCQ